MEIRANYVLVGAFAVLMIVLAVGYAIWAAKSSGREAMMQYGIEFKGDVSGLSVGSLVTFNGIKVGSVRKLYISPTDSSKVDVLIEVQSSLPVRSDSEASLEIRGITGQAAVQISSGRPDSPLLMDVSHEDLPMIKSKNSKLQLAMQSLPEIMSEAQQALKQINGFLSDENKENFNVLIANLAQVSENAKNSSAKLDKLLTNLDKTTQSADRMISDLQDSAQVLNETMSKAGPGIARFSSDGLDEFRTLLSETRLLVNALSRMSNRMETEPRQFLFGSQVQEYDAYTE